jgi:hypothetical protein
MDGTTPVLAPRAAIRHEHPANKREYFPDPAERIDRWHQAANSSNVQNTIKMITDMCEKHRHPFPARIVDPFAGAGSTAVAARLMGVDFFGIEIDPVLACIATAKVSARLPHRRRPRILTRPADKLVRECLAVLTSSQDMWRRPRLRVQINKDLAHDQGAPAASTVICGDTTHPRTWQAATDITGSTVIYTSPPFGHTAQKAPWSTSTHDRAVQALEHAGRYVHDKSPEEASDYPSFVTAMLMNAKATMPGALVIIEHEPAHDQVDERISIAEHIERKADVAVLDILESGNFSGKGPLSFFVCRV